MKKIDFSQVECETIERQKVTVDMTKNIANQIYMTTQDISVMDWARELYYSEGEFDFEDDKIALVKGAVAGMPAFYKVPVMKLLDS
jgi:hypothetical protein